MAIEPSSQEKIIEKDSLVIRFSGDSGDGMQFTGTQFSETSSLLGNDVVTFPDYPAEIRAPKGSIYGVSGFQVHIGSKQIHTPGDDVDLLVAMNPAALKVNIPWIRKGGAILVDSDSFDEKSVKKARFDEHPLESGELRKFETYCLPISSLTSECLEKTGAEKKAISRCKNMFVLGISYWLLNKSFQYTESFLKSKFINHPKIAEINIKALRDGYHYAEKAGVFPHRFSVKSAEIEKGKYRNITGNQATAWGMVAAAEKAGLQLFCGSYPITPATKILEELSALKNLGVKTFQAEDEIAAVCTAIGASYSGALAVTTTSGPGLALKTEALGLAIIAELPLVVVDVQRGGPSTGLPTKTEQSDLLQAIHGRSGESPLIVLAASTPANCFEYAFLACKLSLEHMTPVVLLTDGALGNGSQPWKIVKIQDLPEVRVPFTEAKSKEYLPYNRDPKRGNRAWAIPGMKGKEHRLGSLEKTNVTGTVSHAPENHQLMTQLRRDKVMRVANYIPNQLLIGREDADLLVVGWGGTYGHLLSAVQELVTEGKSIALAHFNHIFPLPSNTQEILKNRKWIVVCELNDGQFAEYLSGHFPKSNIIRYNKIQGLPFTVKELKNKFYQTMEESS